MSTFVISDDLFSKLREFEEYESASDTKLQGLLDKKVRMIAQIYKRGDTILIWKLLDRFALHVISTNRILDSNTLRKAVLDLEKCEKSFDNLPKKDKKTLRAFHDHLYNALITPKSTEFTMYCEKIVTNTNHEILSDLFEKMLKPGTINTDVFSDLLVAMVWKELTSNFNKDFIRKRVQRIKKFISLLAVAATTAANEDRMVEEEDEED